MMKNQITFGIVTVAIAALVAGLSTIGLGDGIQTAFAQGASGDAPYGGPPSGSPGASGNAPYGGQYGASEDAPYGGPPSGSPGASGNAPYGGRP